MGEEQNWLGQGLIERSELILLVQVQCAQDEILVLEARKELNTKVCLVLDPFHCLMVAGFLCLSGTGKGDPKP